MIPTLKTSLESCQKWASNQFPALTKQQKYGLHMQSNFPLPEKDSTTNTIRYHTSTGTLFSRCNEHDQTTIAQYLPLSYQKPLPPHGIWAHTNIDDGLLVKIAKHSINKNPIIIDLDGQHGVGYILIVAEKDSTGSVIIQHRNAAPSHTIINIVCESQSNLEIVVLEAQDHHPHYTQITATVKENARLQQLQLMRNCESLQSFTHTQINGEKGTVFQGHIAFGGNKNKHDIYSKIEHKAPLSNSQMLSKIILRDEAHTIYRGLVKMEPSANEAKSSQKEQTLLLSPKARIDVVPMLAINTDDIQCSHSASISNVDPEQLFYLQSRGFSYEQAESLIVQGFYGDALKQFSNLALCALINDYLSPIPISNS